MFKLKDITIGGMYRPAVEIETQQEADEYFELLVAYKMGAIIGSGEPVEDIRLVAEQRVRVDLGYFAGYYSSDVQRKVNKLYGTVHPIFGEY